MASLFEIKFNCGLCFSIKIFSNGNKQTLSHEIIYLILKMICQLDTIACNYTLMESQSFSRQAWLIRKPYPGFMLSSTNSCPACGNPMKVLKIIWFIKKPYAGILYWIAWLALHWVCPWPSQNQHELKGFQEILKSSCRLKESRSHLLMWMNRL